MILVYECEDMKIDLGLTQVRKSFTVSLGGIVQQGGLVVQLLVDLNDLSRDGSVDVGGSLDRLDGSDGVYEADDVEEKRGV